ncbi:anosmin-1-like isoform X2 [Xenia sp. Carnegie-2017]|uniref:anosmin-1-like isoform X2 n=1 Tax=Xenia sp. Carnegie-2017 TaxID=2897299 RepID=UPI001F0424EC|nr:anosmin-1-like isoform X2 [Xenia sp. Carnegie-2017]
MNVVVTISLVLHLIWLAQGTIIYSAQCRSRCHSLFNPRREERKLKQCISPCDKDDQTLSNCRNFCEKQWTSDIAPCHYSCKNLKSLQRYDYGTGSCSLRKQKSFDNYCDRIQKCQGLKKCCSRTNTCENIIVNGEEVEIKVEAVTKSSVVIKWQKSNITNAVYIIQLRELNSRTIYYKEKDWFAWEQILQTTKVNGIKVTNLPYGIRLQFRIAVVNISGLQSVGPPTPVIRTLYNASKPSGPQQIWVIKKTYFKGSVSITLNWKPPAILDVPVHSYRIYWKKIAQVTTDLAVTTKKRTRVKGLQYNYTIHNLQPDSRYHIEIQAVCLWKKNRLKSPKVALNVSTGHIKDDGHGVVDVYIMKETKKDKDNHSPIYFDQNNKDVKVLTNEKVVTTVLSPSKKDRKEHSDNSSTRRCSFIWLITMWITCFRVTTDAV